MAQHFLLSPEAKTLSLIKVLRMTDKAAENAFRSIRWAETDGKPICPECGCPEHYNLKSRPVWKCKGCKKQFSITSGTIFHGRKLALRDILGAIAIFTNGAKGISALQMSRDLGVSYNCAFVLCHKMREAIALARAEGALSGNVEVDGAYFGGYVKPRNRREDRKDLRRRQHQTGKRQVVIVARETKGRTLTHVAKSEAAGVAFARSNIAAGSTVHADEASFPIKRINHKRAYSEGGANTNAAEGFFSRLRRAEIGTHHHIAGKHLASYASEMAWREDARRQSNGNQFTMIMSAAAMAPKSEAWCGFWQR